MGWDEGEGNLHFGLGRGKVVKEKTGGEKKNLCVCGVTFSPRVSVRVQ